ncbi:cob(I)yrinic acid a,c-diamide adenosyltransferase [Candidatus Pacearchaeota archaeon ex4484_26]|nr:MAG: cob(I)yrinic acid a,c-diamide adenosyltransferase [Candidatus Pacearchaeota archaeon ex4484_26]
MKLKGLVHIYTGEGRGKTSIALGTALRAARYGLKTYFIQFMKTSKERKTIKQIKNVAYKCFGQKKWIYKNKIKQIDKKIAERGLKFVESIVQKGNYDLVILDEIIMAVWFGLLKEKDILTLIEKKPEHVELILTGRGASKRLINAADYVSEIKKVKHPYDKGILARRGIDY